MKTIIIISSFLIAVVLSAPQNDIQITRYSSDNDGAGNYQFAYEQSDGTKREESGNLENAGGEEPSIAVRGSFSYLGPDNVVYTVNYVADANGFQPVGAHLPQPPEGSIAAGPGRGPPPAAAAFSSGFLAGARKQFG